MLTSNVASPVVGQAVTLTATVTLAPPYVGVPPAGIVFYDGATVLGAVAPVKGQASVTTSALTVGAAQPERVLRRAIRSWPRAPARRCR